MPDLRRFAVSGLIGSLPEDSQPLAAPTKRLGKRVIERLDDAVSAVRAYAEQAEPAVAVKMLKVLEDAKRVRWEFEQASRGGK